MDNNLQNQIDELKKQVKDLTDWKEARMKQQVTAPFDLQSQRVLNKYFMSIFNTFTYKGGAGSNSFQTFIGKQDNLLFSVDPPTLNIYTVNPTSNVLTISSGNLKYYDTQTVTLFTDGTAPNPLSAGLGIIYYVRDSTDGVNFKLALTSGGAAIDITNTGSGTQFISYS